MTGIEIESLIRSFANEETEAAFLGIFAMDCLPKSIPKLPALFVVNTQTSNLPGQHWKAVFIGRDKRGEVFDSLAMPVGLLLQNWMNTYTIKWKQTKQMIQSPLSAFCGAFIAFFVLQRLRAKSMKTCLNIFKKDLFYNDVLIANFVRSLRL